MASAGNMRAMSLRSRNQKNARWHFLKNASNTILRTGCGQSSQAITPKGSKVSNQQIVEKFLSCYQQHDYEGMQSCLDDGVRFSDFAFDIHGKEVISMWHWFCIKYPHRETLHKSLQFRDSCLR